MPDRVTYARENPGIKNASWNKTREGVQDIQEIVGVKEWVAPRMQRDDSREGTGLEPLRNLMDVPVLTTAETMVDSDVQPQFEYQSDLAAVPAPAQIVENVTTGHKFSIGAHCILCQRPEKECGILVKIGSGRICDQCTEQAIDAMRQEIPKRRLRLALERMMQGEVTEAMVAEIEKMAKP